MDGSSSVQNWFGWFWFDFSIFLNYIVKINKVNCTKKNYNEKMNKINCKQKITMK